MDSKEDSNKACPYTCVQCDWEESALNASKELDDPSSSTTSWVSSHRFSQSSDNSFDVYGNIEFSKSVKDESNKQFPNKLECTGGISVNMANIRRKKLYVECERTGSKCTIIAPDKSFCDIHPSDHYSTCLDLSPNGQLAISGSLNGNLRLWNPWNGLKAVDLKVNGHAGDITTCKFFPNGGVVVSGSSDAMLKIWAVDNPNGECAVSLKGHLGGILCCDIVGFGRNIVSSSRDGTCKLWNCGSQKALATFKSSREMDPNDVVQRQKLAVNHCFVMNGFSSGSSGDVSEEEFETEGTLLVTSREDGRLCCFDIRQRKEAIDIYGCQSHSALNCSTQLNSQSDKHVVVGSESGVITLWDLRHTIRSLCTFQRSDGSITSLISGKEPNTFWASQSTGGVSLWNVEGECIDTELSGPDCDPVLSMSLYNNLMITSCKDIAIRKYNL